MEEDDAVELVIEPRRRPVGNGEVRRVLPWRGRRMIGPFIFADLMGPDDVAPGAGVDVDAHPHIGLSTLTYLVAGRLVHRDSTGVVQTIEAGDVNWMTAGAGVCHTERTAPEDRPVATVLHGVQTWVALPGEVEDGEAWFQHTSRDDLPSDGDDRARVRLVAGEGWGMQSPVAVSSALVLAELRLAGGNVELDARPPERGVLVLDGRITIDGRPLEEGRLAVVEPGRRPVVGGEGRAVVLGGEPVGKRFIWWNFVHSSQDRIEEAKRDWTAQCFPLVPDDHDPWVPLPGA